MINVIPVTGRWLTTCFINKTQTIVLIKLIGCPWQSHYTSKYLEKKRRVSPSHTHIIRNLYLGLSLLQLCLFLFMACQCVIYFYIKKNTIWYGEDSIFFFVVYDDWNVLRYLMVNIFNANWMFMMMSTVCRWNNNIISYCW